MIKYNIISGTPTSSEKEAIELALAQHERPKEIIPLHGSKWGRPQLRAMKISRNTGSTTWFK